MKGIIGCFMVAAIAGMIVFSTVLILIMRGKDISEQTIQEKQTIRQHQEQIIVLERRLEAKPDTLVVKMIESY